MKFTFVPLKVAMIRTDFAYGLGSRPKFSVDLDHEGN